MHPRSWGTDIKQAMHTIRGPVCMFTPEYTPYYTRISPRGECYDTMHALYSGVVFGWTSGKRPTLIVTANFRSIALPVTSHHFYPGWRTPHFQPTGKRTWRGDQQGLIPMEYAIQRCQLNRRFSDTKRTDEPCGNFSQIIYRLVYYNFANMSVCIGNDFASWRQFRTVSWLE